MVTIYGSRGFTVVDLPNPDLVLGWDTARPSQSVVHRIPGRESRPVFTLREHGSREGTLRLFYRAQADAAEVDAALAEVAYLWVIDAGTDAPGSPMSFYATGDVRVTAAGDNDRPWVVEVGFTEVIQ